MSHIYVEGQTNLSYQLPHDDILKLADVTPAPLIRMNKEATLAMLLYRSNYKGIDELSEEEFRLAGLRINPKTNISSRARYYIDMRLLDVASGQEMKISGLPSKPRITNVTWSHNQQYVAFTNISVNSLDLWLIDLNRKEAQKLSDMPLNANMGSVITWKKDDNSLIVKVLPEDRQPLIDRASSIPEGPTVAVNEGQKAQNRTYQDLLKNPTDEENFETLARSELWEIGLDGQQKKWLKSDLYSGVSLSPDGSYVLVTTIGRPFSYIVPYYRFPQNILIFSDNGALVKRFLEVPLIEEMPKGFMATRTGPRSISWRSDKPSTLYWVEALDDGDPAKEVEYRDAVYQLDAPFATKGELLTKSKERYRMIIWGRDETAVLYERWWNTRNLRTLIINPSIPSSIGKLVSERNYQDRYSDPGLFATEENQYGQRTLTIEENNLFLLGDGYQDDGKFPFVDKLELASGTVTRLWQSKDTKMLEDISGAIDMKEGKILVQRESKTEFPNFYFRNFKNGKLQQITKFENPFSALNSVHKEIINYTREDGLELSATLYLPVGYDESKKEKMPMLMWAYPREHKDKNTASQTTSYANEFTYPYYGSPLYWVNRGYVILEDVAFPIVGEGDEEPNDSFRRQLVSNAKAAIDAVDMRGYIDRSKVAIGGHSYGAFMTANLLSHSNLFAAGIARSGAYNRTLTPFGFQAEERSYWDAPDVYYTMSPFMHADKMKTPLLLIHGEADNNSGTYPMQSERYFNALKGLGATVRLVMLPKESHGYAARESILHMLWEQDQWLERYVKNKDVPVKP